MRRTVSLLLSLLLILLLGCKQAEDVPASAEADPSELAGTDEPSEQPDVRMLADAVLPRAGKVEALELESLNRDTDADRLAAYIELVCGLTRDGWEDADVIRGTGASAFEIVVLRLGDEETAKSLEPVLTDYLTTREGAFTGYAPDEAEMASNGQVRREERTVGLFICPDPEGAAAAFSAAYHGEALPVPVEPEPVEEPEDFAPLFEARDLMYRLLVEAACPDWNSQEEKGWTDGTDGVEYKYGIEPDQYVEFDVGYWGPYTLTVPDLYTPEIVFQENRYEISVFRATSEDGALELVNALDSYRIKRSERLRAEGDEALAEIWDSGRAVSSGRYAVLIVSDYVEETIRLFPRIVNDPDTSGFLRRFVSQPTKPADPDPDYLDRTRFVPPNEEDMSLYDTSAILAAWEKKDPSGLSGDDRAIYDAAETLLAEIMEPGMTDLEKETAAYHWLVENVNYDWTHQDPLAETDRRAFGPYGGLVDRSAVCLGYATSFQLLMDFSGIECITIVGAGSNSTMDHGWNMVKLNGEWYCTDVAWDANARELSDDHDWRYFNLTSDEMARSHQWDYANTPEATATDRGGAAFAE